MILRMKGLSVSIHVAQLFESLAMAMSSMSMDALILPAISRPSIPNCNLRTYRRLKRRFHGLKKKRAKVKSEPQFSMLSKQQKKFLQMEKFSPILMLILL